MELKALLKSENRLKKNKEFKITYKKGNSFANRDFVVYYKKNSLGFSRIGFSVSKKVGKAWKRNEIKRRLRETLRKNNSLLSKSCDIIIIVRQTIKDTDYFSMEKSLNHALKGSELID